MNNVVYPPSLPCPQTSTVTPGERRALSDADRPREARNIQRDRLEFERITFPPMSLTDCETLMVFWRDTLKRGGAWFSADWPLPRGMHVQAVRKFREQPKWQFVPGGFWQLSALCEVRGRGKPIDDQVEICYLFHNDTAGNGCNMLELGKQGIAMTNSASVGDFSGCYAVTTTPGLRWTVHCIYTPTGSDLSNGGPVELIGTTICEEGCDHTTDPLPS